MGAEGLMQQDPIVPPCTSLSYHHASADDGTVPKLLRQATVAVFDVGSDEPPPHGAGGVNVWDLASAISSEEPSMRSPGGQPVKKHCHPKDKKCGKPGRPPESNRLFGSC